MKKLDYIEKRYKIKAPVEKVWQALVDEKIIKQWGGCPCRMDDKLGTRWKLWGGDIYGRNVEVSKNKRLVQEWYAGKWEKPSIVAFTLTPEKTKTVVSLKHLDVPKTEAESIDEGWDEYYLGPIKELLEGKKRFVSA